MESCNWAFVFPGLIRWQWTRTGGQGGLRPFISLGVGEGLRGRKAGSALPKSKQPSAAHQDTGSPFPPLPFPCPTGPGPKLTPGWSVPARGAGPGPGQYCPMRMQNWPL